MTMSLSDIFRKGEFWTTLETSLVSLKKSVKQNSKQIRKIENDNNILVEQIKYLALPLIEWVDYGMVDERQRAI